MHGFFPLLSRAFSELNRGRPAAAARTLTEASRVSEHHAGDVYGFAISALFPDADSADFARRRAQVEAYVSGAEPTEPEAITTYRHARCSLELWRVMTGRLHTAASTVAQLREWTAATPHDGTTRPCAYAIQAIYLSQVGAPDAEAAAAQLDSVLLHTFVEQGWREYLGIMSARAWQHLGDRERARAALNRYVRDQRYGRAPLLLEKARVEAGLGYRSDASPRTASISAFAPIPSLAGHRTWSRRPGWNSRGSSKSPAADSFRAWNSCTIAISGRTKISSGSVSAIS